METEIFNIRPSKDTEIILERLAPSGDYKLTCVDSYDSFGNEQEFICIEFSGEVLLQIYQAIGKYIETHKI